MNNSRTLHEVKSEANPADYTTDGQGYRYIILQTINEPHSVGFMVRNRRIFPAMNSKGEKAYNVLGYANNRDEAQKIIFPN